MFLISMLANLSGPDSAFKPAISQQIEGLILSVLKNHGVAVRFG